MKFLINSQDELQALWAGRGVEEIWWTATEWGRLFCAVKAMILGYTWVFYFKFILTGRISPPS